MQKYNFLGILNSKFLIVGFTLLYSCQSNNFEVDTNKIDLQIKLGRLDKDLFSKPALQIDSLNKELKESYGSFYNVYLRDILNIGELKDPMIGVLVDKFRSDPVWKETQVEIENVFPNLATEKEEIEEAFKRYKFFFPSSAIPNLVAYNSGFNVGIYPSDSTLGIGLEWYLGAENKILKQLATEDFPQYKKDQMLPINLVASSLKGWLLYKHQSNLKNETLLDVIVYYGKILFILKTILPGKNENTIVGYSPEQLLWCRKNEFSFWTYLVDNKLIFTKNYKDISRMVSDGPFTSGISQESPAKIGIWLGYEIVKQYVEKTNVTSLQKLLDTNDSRLLLKYYKPSK